MDRQRIRTAILISGGGSNMAALLDEAARDPLYPADFCLVVSNKADAGGLEKAADRDVDATVIPTAGQTFSKFEAQLQALLTEYRIELICLAGFMRVLSPAFVTRWQDRILNIHPSLLPKYKGLNAQRQAFDAGDEQSGATVHYVTAELDAGEIIEQARISREADDTPEAFSARILAQEHVIYPRAVRTVARKLLKQGGPSPVRIREEALSA